MLTWAQILSIVLAKHMHGIFPKHNKYYIHTEIFPYLSKEERKNVYYPPKVSRAAKEAPKKTKRYSEDDEN